MYAISTLLFLVAGKASRVPKVTSSFSSIATMPTERGNDRLITVHAPFLVLTVAPNLNGSQQLTLVAK